MTPARPLFIPNSATLILLSSCLLQACAPSAVTAPSLRRFGLSGYELPQHGSAGSESSDPLLSSPGRHPAPTPEALERARQAEAERALETLWGVLGTADSRGAEWEFRLWSHGGALTLLSWRRLEEGEGPAIPVGRGAFLPHFALTLPSLLGAHPREVTLTLERAETHWSVDLDTSSRDTTPAHTRMIPSARKGISEQTHRQALETARRVSRLLTVPQGGSARLVARVSLEDERIVGLEPAELESSGDGPVLHASEQAVSMVVGTLLPFTRGLGERTVVLSLEGEHRPGEARPRWRVVEARTAEPPPLPKQVADIHQEYRALHESILVEFQEQSREYAILAAGISLEQFAYAIVGGLLIRRALALIELAAPTITSVLAQGGKGAVRWFRNLLVRTSPEDRALLQQLWMKAESQGLKSLTEVEKQQLRGLMGRLESLLSTPLDRRTKQRLWEWSRTNTSSYTTPSSPGCWVRRG